MKNHLNPSSLLRALAGALLAAGQALAPAQAASAEAPIRVPSVQTLAQFPGMTGFRLSPDGKHMLAIQSQGDSRSILVWTLADPAAKPTVIGATSMQIRSASFLKNDMLQVVMSQPYDLRADGVTKTFISKLLFTDLEGKNWVEPMASTDIARTDIAKKQAALANPRVLNRLLSDPDSVVLESDSRGESRDVFRYNLRTAKATRIMRLGESDMGVHVNDAGQPWAKLRSGSDGKGAYIALDFRDSGGEWQEHFRSHVKDRDVVDVVAPGVKPGTAVILSNVGREFAGLYEYDIANRKIGETLFEHKYFDATGVLSIRDDRGPGEDGFDGFEFDGHQGLDDLWVDPKTESIVRGVAQALGIKEVQQELVGVASGERAQIPAFDGVSVQVVEARSGATPTYLIRVSGLSYPTEHYLLRGQGIQLLAKEYPDIDKRALGSSRFVYYKARDGLNIPAYLTLPNPQLCGPGPYAAVVHPHGGPWARDNMQYDGSGWVPLLVSQCRVVLRPQFRGSAGWGRTLWFAGDREWGQKMQDDKDDGAKWLISEKLADPKRIAMFGFSYGGYSAFAASVRPNGLYKCAIAGAGVSDIERIWAKFFTNPFFQQRQEPTVRGLSPLTKADQIEIPIMVYHGDRDQTVPLIQSELFVDKAKAAGKPVEYHVLKDYAHGPAWTRQTNADQLNLISTYLGSGCGKDGL
ncbi:prolyl oligopeptidase family serine peptidase [Roseateles sp.]|uniref:alpha/beta hydrolase family protein n=1 Tax=Roseateles sp. TaxID=1971397 RepID=UPI0025CDE6B1|nr:prolyl oligopeptidase family serine peptidase [Roseateles sp.]MBV8033638.1 S9 family peptidase [Roseateles sp.]